jgi:hypothetical protein
MKRFLFVACSVALSGAASAAGDRSLRTSDLGEVRCRDLYGQGAAHLLSEVHLTQAAGITATASEEPNASHTSH